MTATAIRGETHASKVAAMFATAEAAQDAAAQVIRDVRMEPGQVRVVSPHDADVDHKSEPETRGISRTLVRSHLVLGVGGLLLGALVALILIQFGGTLFSASPYYVGIIGAALGAVAGLLLGGLLSLRPDHGPVAGWVKVASRRNRWFVVVHTRNRDEELRAREYLESLSSKMKRTF